MLDYIHKIIDYIYKTERGKKLKKLISCIARKLRKETFIFYYFCYSIVYCGVIHFNAFNPEYWAEQLWLQLRLVSKRLYHRKSSWELVIKQCISKCMFRSSYEDGMNIGWDIVEKHWMFLHKPLLTMIPLANYFKSFDGETKVN